MDNLANDYITSNFLLELYCEEIPAFLQSAAAAKLKNNFIKKLEVYGLSFNRVFAYSGPCRLTLVASAVSLTVPEQILEKKGPKVDSQQHIIDAFIKNLGITLADLEIIESKNNQCYVYRQITAVQNTINIIPKIVSEILSDLWPKNMRWGNHKCKWIRPLKNILCLFNDQPVHCSYYHLKSTNFTYGHKFLHYEPITINSIEHYFTQLREHKVIVDNEERKELILEQMATIATEFSWVRQDIKLIEEVNGLVEWPKVMIGSIAQEYLNVPSEILITAMRTHQKFFACQNDDGFVPQFVFVANINPVDFESLLRGNEKVLNARLADAKFFYELDLKTSFESMYDKLSNVTFHLKLGSIKNKVDRLIEIAKFFSKINKLEDQQADLEFAAKYCKADLVSSVVNEFPELQGIMGHYYIRHNSDFKDRLEVAIAVKEHYKPAGPNDDVPLGLGGYLSLIDKMDSLVTLFYAGEKATGSGDPYSLRRSALGIIRIILAGSLSFSLKELINFILNLVAKDRDDRHTLDILSTSILTFIEERARIFLSEKFDIKLINSLLRFELDSNLNSINNKLEALHNFINLFIGKELLQSYKRAYSIFTSEAAKYNLMDKNITTELLVVDAEKILVSFIENLDHSADISVKSNYNLFLANLAKINEPLNDFFVNVLVVNENSNLTINRLKILKNVIDLFDNFADFKELIK